VHEVVAEKRRRVGDGGVPAVQDAQLHQLMGGDVLHELHADLFQRGPASGEVILQHPLPEGLASHRHRVDETEAVGHQRPLPVGGRGRDAVHHGIREGDIGRDPVGEGGVGETREAGDGACRDMAVLRKVVAGHDSERRHVGRPSAAERREDHAEDGAGRARRGGIRHHVGVCGIEAA
jgi:hypothetical protein